MPATPDSSRDTARPAPKNGANAGEAAEAPAPPPSRSVASEAQPEPRKKTTRVFQFEGPSGRNVATKGAEKQQVASGRSKSGGAAVKLDLDLDFEVEMKDKIDGDVTLSFVKDDNKKASSHRSRK